MVAAAVVEDGRCLVARRSATMASPLTWELPGGKVRPGETPEAALVREIDEELGLTIAVGSLLGRTHGLVTTAPGADPAAPRRRLELVVHLARRVEGTIAPVEHDRWGWFGPDELDSLDWSPPDRGLVEPLRHHLLGEALLDEAPLGETRRGRGGRS